MKKLETRQVKEKVVNMRFVNYSENKTFFIKKHKKVRKGMTIRKDTQYANN
jgi:hypothetical protein